MTDQSEMPEKLHIQFARGGAHIRKWQGGPFDGGTPYVRADVHAEAMRFVEMVARTALDDDLADDELIYGPDVTAGDVRAARALAEGER